MCCLKQDVNQSMEEEARQQIRSFKPQGRLPSPSRHDGDCRAASGPSLFETRLKVWIGLGPVLECPGPRLDLLLVQMFILPDVSPFCQKATRSQCT